MDDATRDVRVTMDGHVATVLLVRPPHNYMDPPLIAALADALHALDANASCRAVVIGSEGRSFCAGANLGQRPDPATLYGQAMRLFRTAKPIVAAVRGAAIGAGLGLALVADFRVASASSRFSVNFNRLGFHPGFGTSCTLPRVVGMQHAARMFYTGERIDGKRAFEIRLVDALVDDAEVLGHAQALATEIAASAPLAVQSTRQTLRLGLADEVARINARELEQQFPQFETEDFREGVAAASERRTPIFKGR